MEDNHYLKMKIKVLLKVPSKRVGIKYKLIKILENDNQAKIHFPIDIPEAALDSFISFPIQPKSKRNNTKHTNNKKMSDSDNNAYIYEDGSFYSIPPKNYAIFPLEKNYAIP